VDPASVRPLEFRL